MADRLGQKLVKKKTNDLIRNTKCNIRTSIKLLTIMLLHCTRVSHNEGKNTEQTASSEEITQSYKSSETIKNSPVM